MTGRAVVWVNGRLAPADQPCLSARDRGFTLGDGLFETLRVRRGRIVNLDRHLARLRRGLDLLGFDLPWSSGDLAAALAATIAANGLADAAVRLTVSRGVAAARGLLPPLEPRPTVAIDATPFAGYPADLAERGLRLVTSAIRRNEWSPVTRVKSLNYLDSVLARREAAAAGADEAILWNTGGQLAGASAANLFLWIGEILVTPDPAAGALPGTTRDLILSELAPSARLNAVERSVDPGELTAATEAFLTSALLGILPVGSVDGRPIGSGQPGPRTRRLQAAYQAWVEAAPDRRPTAR